MPRTGEFGLGVTCPCCEKPIPLKAFSGLFGSSHTFRCPACDAELRFAKTQAQIVVMTWVPLIVGGLSAYKFFGARSEDQLLAGAFLLGIPIGVVVQRMVLRYWPPIPEVANIRSMFYSVQATARPTVESDPSPRVRKRSAPSPVPAGTRPQNDA